MTFNRLSEVPRGHRLYTRATTLADWGASGPRAVGAANDNYSSRGRRVTWPTVPGDWSTCRRLKATKPREHQQQANIIETWLDGRVCRFPTTITGGTWERPTGMPIVANDNTPRRSVVRLQNDGPTQEWLAERDAAGFAVDYGSDGNRIERVLVKEKSPLVAALRQVAELMRPPVIAANNNAPANDDGERVNSGKGHERVHNQGSITPSVPMLLRAVSDGMRPRVIRHPDGSITRIDTGHRVVDGWHLSGWTDGKKLHGIIVNSGELTAYGDDKGRKRRPDYKANRATEAVVDEKSETAKHIAAQPEENRTYVRLRGRERYISHQRPDAPGSIAPVPRTARATANDNELQAAIANTQVLPPIQKLPDGVAADYGRLAGVAETKGVGEGKTSAPMHDALSELERQEELAAAGFHDEDLAVVDAILSDSSFRTIGLQFRYAESSAHRMGRKVVEDVLTRISGKIAA